MSALTTHEALKEAFRRSVAAPASIPVKFSTTFHNCPEAGTPLWALTKFGEKLRIECDDDDGRMFSAQGRTFTRSDLFIWWLDADDLPPAPYVLSERQEWAEYEAEIEDQQRQYGEE